MALKRICYHCKITRRISILILKLISNNSTVIGDANKNWAKNFATEITALRIRRRTKP